LTTVRIPYFEMGAWSVGQLMDAQPKHALQQGSPGVIKIVEMLVVTQQDGVNLSDLAQSDSRTGVLG